MALTRAQQICFIMGPLDMRGLVGAATIIGCLKYGANEWKYGILLAAEEVVRAGVLSYAQVVRAKSFTCFTLHRLVRFCWLVLVCWGGLCLLCVVWFGSLTNLCDRVINR